MPAGVGYGNDADAGPAAGGSGTGRRPTRRQRAKRFRRKQRAYRRDQRLERKHDRYNRQQRLDQRLDENYELPIDAGAQRQLSQLQMEGDRTAAYAGEDLAALYSRMVDPMNPFAQQALVQRELKQAHAENLTSMAAQGHLYGGGLVARDRRTAFEGARAQDTLARDYTEQASGIGRARDEKLAELAGMGEGILFDATQRAARDVESTEAGGKILKQPKRQPKGVKKPKRPRFMKKGRRG